MTYRYLKDVLVYGATYKAGETFTTDSYDRELGDRVDLCIGHGMHFPLKIGEEIELVINENTQKCPTCGK